MSTQTAALTRRDVEGEPRLATIDADVHPLVAVTDREILEQLPERWREHTLSIGLRLADLESQIPRQRAFAARGDAIPANGRLPGGDPGFAREQLLDAYDLSAAILNNVAALLWGSGSGNSPLEYQLALCRAVNDWHRHHWLASDPRWRASINVPWEAPTEAAREIARCRSLSDGFIQVLLETRADSPIGNPRYWPIFAAAVEHDLPVGFHVGANRRITASGTPNFYFEDHCDFAIRNFSIVASLIFEGVFEKFPTLKVALIEQGWSWAVPFAWRLDASWKVLRAEVPHLRRRPSEYLRDHFWYTTQPVEEPERLEWFGEVMQMFIDFAGDDRLMYSSDYPHWDFDAPDEAVPQTLDYQLRGRLLGRNAAALYGIDLNPAATEPTA